MSPTNWSRPQIPRTLGAALLLAACKNPQPATDDTAGGGGDDTAADSGEPDVEPVWEDLRLETSDTLTACYASGQGLYVVTEGGLSWVRQSGAWTSLGIDVEEESLNGLWGTGSGESLEMLAVGDAGWVAHWTSGAWVEQDVGTANLESVSGEDANSLVAVGWGGVFTYEAGAWAFQSIEGNPRFNHVWFDGSVAFAVGEDGAIGVYDKGAWTVTTHDSRRRLYGVSGVNPGDVWAVGERGTVLHWDGSAWTQIEDLDTELSLWAVHAASANAVYVVGNNGAAWVYDGAAWTELPTGVGNNLYAITASSDGVVWAVGNRGMALRYTP